jgi:hypothetical protein
MVILIGWNVWLTLHFRNKYLCTRKLLRKLHRNMILDITHAVKNVNVKLTLYPTNVENWASS